MDDKVMTGVQPKVSLARSLDVQAMVRDRDKSPGQEPIALEVQGLNLYYGEKQALKNISLTIPQKKVTAFIGPSGCGKSTLLRCFNRMNDLIDGCRTEGAIRLYGRNIFDADVDAAQLRRRIGMVF